MHKDFVNRHKKWDDRIEVQYFSVSGLKTFKSKTSKMANISPGEPLHIINSGIDWLLNWYLVQEYGITLFGPTPDFIDPISKEEFLNAVKDHAIKWKDYVVNTKYSRHYQSYAILTMCRALYTLRHGEQVSKKNMPHGFKKNFLIGLYWFKMLLGGAKH